MAVIHEIQYSVNYSLPPLFKFEVFRFIRGSAPKHPVHEQHVNRLPCTGAVCDSRTKDRTTIWHASRRSEILHSLIFSHVHVYLL